MKNQGGLQGTGALIEPGNVTGLISVGGGSGGEVLVQFFHEAYKNVE